jgi:L,D-peptidoglycan transpeptidase YkuD (ErfK/YbiS/YcfS/YnhG family)
MRTTRFLYGAVSASAALCLLTACGGTKPSPKSASAASPASNGTASTRTTALPGVGKRLAAKIPAATRQVVAVYGEGVNSAEATVVLYSKKGAYWERTRSWPAHNGRKGWTLDHRADDKRSPVGVFGLTDAGGVLADPGAHLPYTESAAFQAPRNWGKGYWNDFDYVIAIDYNRLTGTSPLDPTRPQGQSKGGSIWLHMDHGSGTSACVSLSKAGMAYLLRTLDPAERPMVVMGDKADLEA